MMRICVVGAGSIGGYLAGRLRTRWVGVHTREVYFRDTAHGFLAWAAATVFSAAVLGAAATHVVSGASGGLANAAGQAATQSAPMETFVDTLFRTDPAANPTVSDTTAVRREVERLFMSTIWEGRDLPPADRAYVTQLVAARTGISQADAEKRVSDVIVQAKTAADDARKAAAHLSLWLTASLLIGAFAASLAATEGGNLRDNHWIPRA